MPSPGSWNTNEALRGASGPMAVAGVPDQRRPVKAALARGQADPQAPCSLATRGSARERPAFLAGLFDFAANHGAALGLFRLHDGPP